MKGVLKPSDRRLSAIVELVPRCGCAADVGTDHGKIGAQLLISGKCEKVVFSDISPSSLEKARKLVETCGLSDKAEFCVTDGLSKLPYPVDSIVIAGMGGLNIRDIFVRGKNAIGNALLVLQPNTEIKGLRLALCENGFAISDERIAREGNRFYVMICAIQGRMKLTEAELTAGPILLKSKSEEVTQYFSNKLDAAEKLITEVEKAGAAESLKALKRERDIWKTALSE